MRWVLLLLACFIALAASFSSTYPQLLILRDVSQNDVNELISRGFDVRGTYGGYEELFTILIIRKNSSLPTVGYAVNIGYWNEVSEQVWIGEYAGIDGDSTGWEHSLYAGLTPSARTFVFSGTCIIIDQIESEDKLLSNLPEYTELVALPDTISIPFVSSSLPAIGFSTVIEGLVASVSEQQLLQVLTRLTAIHTRTSVSSGAVEASTLIMNTFSQYGLKTTLYPFRSGYSSNVIAEITGQTQPSKIVIIGAHYDCRAANSLSTTDRAPGANDDGSGVAALMEIARVLIKPGLTIPFTIRIIAFSGEEQGLYGSTAYANQMRQNGADIVAMLQADMVAYQAGSAPRMELASRFATIDLNTQIEKISLQYVPTLPVGRTTSCCSDQQPFFNNGYPSAAYNEGGGYTIDPEYHRVGDVVNRPGYSINQLKLITQSVLAAAATLAQVS